MRIPGFILLLALATGSMPLRAQDAGKKEVEPSAEEAASVAAAKEKLQNPPPLSLSLQEAIARALEQNLDLAVSRIQPQREQTSVLSQKGAFDPRLNLETRYSQNSTPRGAEEVAADGVPAIEANTFSAGATVTQPTSLGTEVGLTADTSNRQTTYNNFEDEYDSFAGVTMRHPLLKGSGYNANTALLRIAQKGVQQADASFLNSVENTILQVHDAYIELLFAQSDLESKKQSLKLAQQLEMENLQRVTLGAMTPLDVAQARSEAASRQAEVVQAQLVVQRSENRLRRLITNNYAALMDRPISPTDPLTPPQLLPPPQTNIAIGLENRKDYQALLYQAEQDGIRISYTKNQLLPQVDLQGSYGFNGLDKDIGESFNRVVSTDDPNWFIGLAVEVPWGNDTEKASHEDAKLQKAQTLLQIKALEQQIMVDIDNAAKEVAGAQATYTSNQIARIISEETAKAEEERLKAGVSTSYTVLQLQRDAATARTRELRSLADYHLAVTSLRRAQGTLMQASGIEAEGAIAGIAPSYNVRKAIPLEEPNSPGQGSQ